MSAIEDQITAAITASRADDDSLESIASALCLLASYAHEWRWDAANNGHIEYAKSFERVVAMAESISRRVKARSKGA